MHLVTQHSCAAGYDVSSHLGLESMLSEFDECMGGPLASDPGGLMRLSRSEFRRLVRLAVEELPSRFRDVLENVAILVEDWPSREDLAEAEMGDRHQLFGLYTGVPLPDREGGMPLLPDTITLFQRPIESSFTSRKRVVREIRLTLLHEVGHYLGMSEEDLEKIGYG